MRTWWLVEEGVDDNDEVVVVNDDDEVRRRASKDRSLHRMADTVGEDGNTSILEATPMLCVCVCRGVYVR